MNTEKENIESINRDREILKLVGGLQKNIRSLKEITDLLTTRIEKLEKGKPGQYIFYDEVFGKGKDE
tara:strand:+ start:578 stop:778 length:201 start_codon:yes stop_codon:yes gene_type:complete